MSLKIVGFMGKRGHGKDTCSDYVTKYGYKKYAFATILKEFLALVFGLNDDQLYGNSREVIDQRWGVSPRVLMQFFGTTVFRNNIAEIMPNIKDNFWVECLKNRINSIVEQNSSNGIDTFITISDVRFQNEVNMIHSLGGIVIKINRDSIKSLDNHQSETEMDNINDYDYLIDNNDTINKLYENIDSIMNKI